MKAGDGGLVVGDDGLLANAKQLAHSTDHDGDDGYSCFPAVCLSQAENRRVCAVIVLSALCVTQYPDM